MEFIWVNDDIDRQHTVDGSDTEQDDLAAGSSHEDWRDNYILWERDLEDFARLHIYTAGLNEAFKNGDLHLGLKWADVSAGAPSIQLYPAYETDGGSGYLTDSTIAHQQAIYRYAVRDAHYSQDEVAREESDHTRIEGTDVFVLPASLFSGLSETAPQTHLLFEGCAPGKGQLKIVILKKEGTNYTEIGEEPGVWMDLQPPHKFIQRWTCGDGSLAPVVGYTLDTTKSGTFGAPIDDSERDLVLYVHGYNMQDDEEKQRWIETAFKRLYWLGYKGRVAGFTWPCVLNDGSQFDASEEIAWKAGTELYSLLATLKGQGYRVHVLAHSMGNVVMGEALRLAGPNSELVLTYVASQAAIAAHCYDASLPDRSGATAFTPTTPNVYARYWTYIEDANLPETWGSLSPGYLAPAYVQGAAGKFVNFYNPLDWALRGNGINPYADDGTQLGWLTNQRLKPDVGYDYASYIGFRESPLLHFDPKQYAFPDDRFVIFSYCAQARSLALGMTSTGGVFSGSEVNLNDAPYDFLNQHIYHSGQFRSFYAARVGYWTRLLIEMGLKAPE